MTPRPQTETNLSKPVTLNEDLAPEKRCINATPTPGELCKSETLKYDENRVEKFRAENIQRFRV